MNRWPICRRLGDVWADGGAAVARLLRRRRRAWVGGPHSSSDDGRAAWVRPRGKRAPLLSMAPLSAIRAAVCQLAPKSARPCRPPSLPVSVPSAIALRPRPARLSLYLWHGANKACNSRLSGVPSEARNQRGLQSGWTAPRRTGQRLVAASALALGLEQPKPRLPPGGVAGKQW